MRCSTKFGWEPVVDPITSALFVTGLWLALAAVPRRAPLRFLFPAYAGSAFVVGAISQHPCPPLTRLLAIVPLVALLAGWALVIVDLQLCLVFSRVLLLSCE